MGNYAKTILLLGILSALLIAFGGFIGGENGIYTAFIVSLAINGGMYFFADSIALLTSGAKPLDEKNALEIYEIVSELAGTMNIPMPRLYITPTLQANAFATGRNPSHASVAVTQGLMNTLSRDEVKAVLAHELSHIVNRDILIASIAAVLASSLSFLANMEFYGQRRNRRNGEGGLAILLSLLLPFAAMLIRLSISRQREFEADASGAKTIGSGKPLAKALIAIHNSAAVTPLAINPAFSSLYIENPFGNLGGAMMKFFSTHPPVEERVKRLMNIG